MMYVVIGMVVLGCVVFMLLRVKSGEEREIEELEKK